MSFDIDLCERLRFERVFLNLNNKSLVILTEIFELYIEVWVSYIEVETTFLICDAVMVPVGDIL